MSLKRKEISNYEAFCISLFARICFWLWNCSSKNNITQGRNIAQKNEEKRDLINTEKGWEVDLKKVYTVGNHSWIPLHWKNTPDQLTMVILPTLSSFEEKKHVKITSWHIEKEQRTHSTHDFVYGIWVDHEPMLL